MKLILRNSNLIFQNRDLVEVVNQEVTTTNVLNREYLINTIAPGVTNFIVEVDIISTSSTAPNIYQLWGKNTTQDQHKFEDVSYGELSQLTDFTGYKMIFIYGTNFTSGDKVRIKIYK